MKISGPKGVGPPVSPPPEELAQPRPAQRSFGEVLQPTGAAAAAPAVAAATAATRVTPVAGAGSPTVADISDRLRAGEIDGTEATKLLVDAVVRAHLPAVATQLQEQLRTTLRRLLEEDPVLAAKVRRLAEERK